MKFHIAINLERMDDSTDMLAVRDHTLDMVKMADQAGFEIAWAAEHHALEMTIAPNPFQIMTWWADHTENIRLGCAVANASYWHPINLAGEAAMLDLLSDGRLDLGLGSGAYQREFDRMRPGVDQKDGYKYMQEMLPLIRELWKGDVAHDPFLQGRDPCLLQSCALFLPDINDLPASRHQCLERVFGRRQRLSGGQTQPHAHLAEHLGVDPICLAQHPFCTGKMARIGRINPHIWHAFRRQSVRKRLIIPATSLKNHQRLLRCDLARKLRQRRLLHRNLTETSSRIKHINPILRDIDANANLCRIISYPCPCGVC